MVSANVGYEETATTLAPTMTRQHVTHLRYSHRECTTRRCASTYRPARRRARGDKDRLDRPYRRPSSLQPLGTHPALERSLPSSSCGPRSQRRARGPVLVVSRASLRGISIAPLAETHDEAG
ncbi:hypothetical protein BJY59DRAFT_164628 [Rhodotorula toruloides]